MKRINHRHKHNLLLLLEPLRLRSPLLLHQLPLQLKLQLLLQYHKFPRLPKLNLRTRQNKKNPQISLGSLQRFRMTIQISVVLPSKSQNSPKQTFKMHFLLQVSTRTSSNFLICHLETVKKTRPFRRLSACNDRMMDI